MLSRRLARISFVLGCLGLVVLVGFQDGLFSARSIFRQRERFDIVINEVMTKNRGLVQAPDGGFYGCIELYNAGDAAVDLTGFGLSKNAKNPFQWVFPAMRIEPKGYVTIWTSGRDGKIDETSAHANFRLNASDNVAVLTAPSRMWRTALLFGHMDENISYGRSPDGSDALYWFDGCTVGGPNGAEPLVEGRQVQRLAAPQFSLDAGFYEGDVLLELSSVGGAEILYTLNGSEPNKNSLRYTGPLCLQNRETPYVVRACAFKAGYPRSAVVTRTYFVDEGISGRYDIPVVSLATDPSNLFDYGTGILVAGKVRDDWLLEYPETAGQSGIPANYNQKGKLWERGAHLELFSPDGTARIAQGIGLRTHGGYSLDLPNKSLRLLADLDYGESDRFDYDFFSEGADAYMPLNGLILRNSATDSQNALFRDAFIQSLADPQRLDLQPSCPCIAFINGAYYGIYNIRPLYGQEYLARKYGFAPEDVVIIKNPTGNVGDEIQSGVAGDELPYNKLIAFIKNADMKRPENYEYIITQVDIDNYIEYVILEIYCDNSDWLANNVRIWRKRTERYEPDAPYGEDGRWRWLVYDLDMGFGLFEASYQENALAAATAAGGDPSYGNDQFTIMLRTLLTNEQFKLKFITRFLDLLNTAYSPQTAVAQLDAMLETYLPYVPKHIQRWNLHFGSMEHYLSEIEFLRQYARNRPDAVRSHIGDYFGLSTVNALEISVSGEGSVRLNTLLLGAEDLPFTGLYFSGIPVTLTAIPQPGYGFAGWEGAPASEGESITLDMASPVKLRAAFAPIP